MSEAPDAQNDRRATAIWRGIRDRIGVPRVRDVAASAMIVVVLGSGVAGNLPAAAITRAVAPLVDRIAVPLGLDQNWSMYAPNPPQRQEDIEVHIAMADKSERVWTLPRTNAVFGVAYSHRWRKYKENLLTERQIRAEFAHWAVRELTRPGDQPVTVVMLLRTREIPPPGAGGPGQTAVETLYSENLAGNR